MLGPKPFPLWAEAKPEGEHGGGEKPASLGPPPEKYVSDLKCAVAGLANHHLSVLWGEKLLTLDKSMGFRENPTFRASFDAIRGSHIYDEYDGPDTIIWRLNTLCWAAARGLHVGGDFVECGVFKGDMAWVVTQVV